MLQKQSKDLGLSLRCLRVVFEKKKKQKQEPSSDSIACLDELKVGMQLSWAWARYCSMKLWPSIYDAKYEPDPSSSS